MKKSILITSSDSLRNHFRSILKKHGIEVETEPLLADVDAIEQDVRSTRNTSNIRTKFGEFIKKHGLPFMLILDYMHDFGLDKELDPDKRKLLRTFAISYAILLQGKGYIRKHNQIVLIGEQNYQKHLLLLSKQPHHIFRLMRTENEKVNQFLDVFSQQPELADGYFDVNYIIRPDQGVIQGQLSKIVDLIKVAERKYESSSQGGNERVGQGQVEGDESRTEAAVSKGSPEGVTLYYRLPDNRLIVDGEILNYNKEAHGELMLETLYIKGQWWSQNQMEVVEQIVDLYKNTLVPTWKENHGDKEEMNISIFLTDEVDLESGMVPSLIQMVERELKPLGKISLYISPHNREKLSKAAGFNFLDSYFLDTI
jgi:hypothetical protein